MKLTGYFLSIFLFICFFVILIAIVFDQAFFTQIHLGKEGVAPSRNVVSYGKEGNFIIQNNGSINYYEPGELYCVSFSKTPFSIGDFVSNSEGVLNSVQAEGYMQLKGKKVKCYYKSLSDDRSLPYSVFFGGLESALLSLGIFCFELILIVLVACGISFEEIMNKLS